MQQFVLSSLSSSQSQRWKKPAARSAGGAGRSGAPAPAAPAVNLDFWRPPRPREFSVFDPRARLARGKFQFLAPAPAENFAFLPPRPRKISIFYPCSRPRECGRQLFLSKYQTFWEIFGPRGKFQFLASAPAGKVRVLSTLAERLWVRATSLRAISNRSAFRCSLSQLS